MNHRDYNDISSRLLDNNQTCKHYFCMACFSYVNSISYYNKNGSPICNKCCIDSIYDIDIFDYKLSDLINFRRCYFGEFNTKDICFHRDGNGWNGNVVTCCCIDNIEGVRFIISVYYYDKLPIKIKRRITIKMYMKYYYEKYSKIINTIVFLYYILYNIIHSVI